MLACLNNKPGPRNSCISSVAPAAYSSEVRGLCVSERGEELRHRPRDRQRHGRDSVAAAAAAGAVLQSAVVSTQHLTPDPARKGR